MSTANALSQFQNYMAMQKPWKGANTAQNPNGVKSAVPVQNPTPVQAFNPNGVKASVPQQTPVPMQAPNPNGFGVRGNWNQNQGAIGQAAQSPPVSTMPVNSQTPTMAPQVIKTPVPQALQTPSSPVPQNNHRYVENAPPPSKMQNDAMQRVSALPPDSRAKFQEILMQRMKQMQDQQGILRNRK